MPISNADATKIAKEVIRLLNTEKIKTPSALIPELGSSTTRDKLLQAVALRADLNKDKLVELYNLVDDYINTPPDPGPEPEPDPDPETPTDPEDPPTGYPDATNTGFLGDTNTLERTRGRRIIKAGTIIENQYIDTTDGGLIIDAENVTIRNCVFNVGIWGVDALDSATNLVVEDSTFIGGYQAAIGLSQAKNWAIRRNNFHSGRDAIKPGGSGVIESNYMHDPATGGDAHNDCIQFSNADGVTIRNNRMEGADTSCIAMFDGQATFKNVTIENNHMTGAGYILYAGGSTGSGIKVKNNVFGNWGWGPVTDWDSSRPGNEWSGNVSLSGVEIRP